MAGEARLGGGEAADGLLLDGQLAPPMANGEVLFDAPWQGRVFAMARVLADAGHYTWDEFRSHLIAQIGAWDAAHPAAEPGADYRYYDHVLAALQALLAEKHLVATRVVEERVRTFAGRPHGHDHDH
jgi:nitrile hydratase accessory protein